MLNVRYQLNFYQQLIIIYAEFFFTLLSDIPTKIPRHQVQFQRESLQPNIVGRYV